MPPTSWDSDTLRDGSMDTRTSMNDMGGTRAPQMPSDKAMTQPAPDMDTYTDYDADGEEDGPARHKSSSRDRREVRQPYIVPARRITRTRTGRVTRPPAHLKDYVMLSRLCPPVH